MLTEWVHDILFPIFPDRRPVLAPVLPLFPVLPTRMLRRQRISHASSLHRLYPSLYIHNNNNYYEFIIHSLSNIGSMPELFAV